MSAPHPSHLLCRPRYSSDVAILIRTKDTSYALDWWEHLNSKTLHQHTWPVSHVTPVAAPRTAPADRAGEPLCSVGAAGRSVRLCAEPSDAAPSASGGHCIAALPALSLGQYNTHGTAIKSAYSERRWARRDGAVRQPSAGGRARAHPRANTL